MFKPGDRVRIIKVDGSHGDDFDDNSIIGIEGTVQRIEDDDPDSGAKVWAIWDDDMKEAFMRSPDLELVHPPRPCPECEHDSLIPDDDYLCESCRRMI